MSCSKYGSIEVESCIGNEPSSIDIITYDNISTVEISQCVPLLSEIENFITVKDILGGSGINVVSISGIYTISSTGLQPSGNYSLVGHTHNSSEIIDFESSVNALIPTNIVHTTGNQTIDGIKTFTDNIFINDLLVSVKPIIEEMTLILSDTQLSAHRFKIIYISNYGDLNSYTITLPNDSSPGDCIILIFGTVISDITVRRRNHNGSGYGPMYTTMGFVRGSTSAINRSYIYYSNSDNFIPAGFYRAWINIPSSEHNHGNSTDHGEIGSVSGLLVITSDNGLLTTTSGINSNYITNFESAVSGLIPPSNFTSLSGVSGIIVTNSGTNYFVGLNDPSIQLADITDLSANARTFLLTSSSDNLRTLINDETGSGVLVFNYSPAFSGIPTVPTASSGTNTNQIASTSFVRNEISNLVDSAPSTLDTLNELAAALGDDPNFATTITNTLASKANLSGAIFTGSVTIPSGTGNFNSLTIDGINVSISGHNHLSNNIIDFNNSVSGLLPVKNISGGSGIDIISSSGNFTISATGLQPSGNYSLVGHTHNSLDILDFDTAVSGLLPDTYDAAVPWTSNHTLIDGTRYLVNDLVYQSGYLYKANYDNESIPVSDPLYWTNVGPGYRLNIDGRDIPNIPYPVTSVNGYSGVVELSTSDLYDFNSSVSGLLPSVSGSGYAISSFANNIYTISVTGLQPSGNYTIVGHTHASNDITDFSSTVSGLLPVKNIVAGTSVNVSSVSGEYTISVTGVAASSASSLITTCHNLTGSTIPKLSAVYINGGHGNEPTINLAIANSEAGSSKTFGITMEDINFNQSGDVVVVGSLIDVNTNQFGVVEGTTLYLSPSVSGALTTTKPLAPNHLVSLGKIVRNHNNQGVIQVSVQNGFELGELHNVSTNGSGDNGKFLQYNSASGLWVSSSSGNFTTLQLNGTGVSVSGHTHNSSNIIDFNSSVSGLLPTISNSGDNRILTSTGSSVGIDAESNLTFDGSTLNVDGNLIFDSFTESVVAIGNSSTSQTLSLTSGTVQTCTLTGNCTFTMPTATAGKSFTMFLNTGSGNYTASFSGVLWSDSAPPTITTTASKVDILSFISDGSYWYGSYSQNYG
jgi:hypothetical protein